MPQVYSRSGLMSIRDGRGMGAYILTEYADVRVSPLRGCRKVLLQKMYKHLGG